MKVGWRFLVINFEDATVLDVGEEIELYRERGDNWIVQHYRVLKKKNAKDGLAQLKVRALGKPRPFDRRKSSRTTSEHAMIVAQFGDEPDCTVVDIGERSLGIIANPGPEIGDVLDLRIHMALAGFEGTVAVSSVTEDLSGQNRYGVVCQGAIKTDEFRRFLKRLKLTVKLMTLEPQASGVLTGSDPVDAEEE